jgi:hypothetical protein
MGARARREVARAASSSRAARVCRNFYCVKGLAGRGPSPQSGRGSQLLVRSTR